MGQVQNFGTGHDADEETKRGEQMIFQGEKNDRSKEAQVGGSSPPGHGS
jgi:hypothetical protein